MIMKFSMSVAQTRPTLDIPPGRLKLDVFNPRWHREKVVVVMGATGTGKSRLSIDLAAQFPAEVINSDKMQVYKGLDIVTNKISEEERCGVPHHLLGTMNPNSDFTSKNFRDMATLAVESISTRGLLPIVVGGSNSHIEELVDDEDFRFQSKYECCFLWVDVSMPVLQNFLSERVHHMVKKGMVDEVRNMFDPHADYSRGIRRSIGVPELDGYLRAEKFLNDQSRARLLHEAICNIKLNTCKLARRQLEKINRLRNLKGWNIHRIDATQVFLKRGEEAHEAWENLVARRSIGILAKFLYGSSTSANVPAAILGTRKEYNISKCLA